MEWIKIELDSDEIIFIEDKFELTGIDLKYLRRGVLSKSKLLYIMDIIPIVINNKIDDKFLDFFFKLSNMLNRYYKKLGGVK